MAGLITILAIVLVATGVVHTFTKDLLWIWVRFRYSMLGFTPTRTAVWEWWTTIYGVIMLLVGIGLYIFVPR
jgi:hypothetical protein